MAGDVPFGSLGDQEIISCRKTILQFMEKEWDYSTFYRRANSYTCTIGPEPGMGYVLMRLENLRQLDSRAPQDLIIGIDDKSVTIKRLAILQAQSLLPLGSQNPDSLYLVQLADVRWFLKRTTINKRYNIRQTCSSSAWCAGTLYDDDPETPYTFLQIIENIWSNFSSFGGFFSYASFLSSYVHGTANLPAQNPENLRFEGISAWDALDQVCQQCGFFLRYDPFVGDVRVMKIGLATDPYPGTDGDLTSGFGGGRASLPGVESQFSLTAKSLTRSDSDDDLNEDAELVLGSAMIPGSVNVAFPTNDASCGEGCEIDASHGWYHTKSVTATRVKALLDAELADPTNGLTIDAYDYVNQFIAGTSVNLSATFYARFSSATSAVATNDTTLVTVAEQMAVDYYRALGYQAHGRIIYGEIKQVIPGPTISEVTWREFGDGLKTEVARWPAPVGLPRPAPVCSVGSGFANYVVRFQVTSYSPSIRTAECIVLSIPYGMTRDDIPGIDEILSTDEETVIHVADPNGCCFNEPSADLLGRAGWAQYMQPLIPDACSDSSYLEPQWEALTLCCGFNGCEDIA